jgi:hypothetical protein
MSDIFDELSDEFKKTESEKKKEEENKEEKTETNPEIVMPDILSREKIIANIKNYYSLQPHYL